MFPIKDIRKHVTDKLDEITVLRKFRDATGILTIGEPQKSDKNSVLLSEIKVESIPDSNVWIFENEFAQQPTAKNTLIDHQKGAFTSAGDKVEKTIIYYNSNRLYLFMIEMKSTIKLKTIQEKVVRKFESSLSTLSIFISAHFEFPQFEDATIYPVGICCYNYYEDPQPNYNRDPRRTAGRVRTKYADGDRMIPLLMEPIGLNRITSPVFFCENPHRDPLTTGFSIDLEHIIQSL